MLENTCKALDSVSEFCGKVIAWLTLFMVVVTLAVVFIRYVDVARLALGDWLISAQELVIWMHAVVFMLGASYTLRHEEHVRVDVFYGSMSEQRRAWVDAIGVIVFLLPVCVYIAWTSLGYIDASWSRHEASPEAGGLPFPWVPLLKSVILIMPVLLSLQGLSLFLKSVQRIRER